MWSSILGTELCFWLISFNYITLRVVLESSDLISLSLICIKHLGRTCVMFEISRGIKADG